MQSLPFVSNSFPIIGHSAELMKNPIALFNRGYQEHGECFALKIPGKNTVVMVGRDANDFFFNQTDKLLNLQKAYAFLEASVGKDFYFFKEQERYLEERKLILGQLKVGSMKIYLPAMQKEISKLINNLGDEGDFDVVDTIGVLAMNISSHAFLGEEFRDKLGGKYFELFREFSECLDYVSPSWLPTAKKRKSQDALKKLRIMVFEWIEERLKAEPKDDFFGNLINHRMNDGSQITHELIFKIVTLLIWAGHETTTGQACWCLIETIKNKKIQEKLRTETESVFNQQEFQNELIDFDFCKSLKYHEAVVKEVERLHPSAYVLMRTANDDFNYKGFSIKKGSLIITSPAVSHKIPSTFEEPWLFKPERFLEKGIANDKNSLVGFGGGVHRCIGVHFARIEMRLILSALNHHYEMHLLDYPHAITGDTVSASWPQQPCRIKYKKRVIQNKNTISIASNS